MSHSCSWQWLTLATLPHCPRVVNLFRVTSRGQCYLSQRAISSYSAAYREWAAMYGNRPPYSNTLLFGSMWNPYSRLPPNHMCTHEGSQRTHVQRRRHLTLFIQLTRHKISADVDKMDFDYSKYKLNVLQIHTMISPEALSIYSIHTTKEKKNNSQWKVI